MHDFPDRALGEFANAIPYGVYDVANNQGWVNVGDSADTGLETTVAHYPPGTSKWNKIEHRLFSFISTNWRGRPLTDIRTIVELIAATTTDTGLTVQAAYDPTW